LEGIHNLFIAKCVFLDEGKNWFSLTSCFRFCFRFRGETPNKIYSSLSFKYSAIKLYEQIF
jgi:hypothetical protein